MYPLCIFAAYGPTSSEYSPSCVDDASYTRSNEYAFTVSSWLPRRGRRGDAARGVRPPAIASSSGLVVTATLVPEMVSALSGCAVFSRGSSGRQRTATLKALSSPSVLVLVAVAFGFLGRGGRGCCGTSSSTAIENWAGATVCQSAHVRSSARSPIYMHPIAYTTACDWRTVVDISSG